MCTSRAVSATTRPVGQVVKTAASHAAIRSSTLLRVTIFNFILSYLAQAIYIVGVYIDEGPPVPIPNTEVKLICADNT